MDINLPWKLRPVAQNYAWGRDAQESEVGGGRLPGSYESIDGNIRWYLYHS